MDGSSKSGKTDDYKRVKGKDSVGVRYDLEYGPPDHITDPELRKAYGVIARKRVAGTRGKEETLDSCMLFRNYLWCSALTFAAFHVPSQPHKFFRQGKVRSCVMRVSLMLIYGAGFRNLVGRT